MNFEPGTFSAASTLLSAATPARKVCLRGKVYRPARELGLFLPFGTLAKHGKIEKNLPSGTTG